jgi:hypothetical protein
MSRPTKAAKLRRPVAGSQIHMTCRVVGADRPQAAAPPVAGSCIFDPSLLLGDQALHELGPFFLVSLDTLRQRQSTTRTSGLATDVAENSPGIITITSLSSG